MDGHRLLAEHEILADYATRVDAGLGRHIPKQEDVDDRLKILMGKAEKEGEEELKKQILKNLDKFGDAYDLNKQLIEKTEMVEIIMHPVAMALYVGADFYKPVVDKVQAGVELVCCASFVGVSTPPPGVGTPRPRDFRRRQILVDR